MTGITARTLGDEGARRPPRLPAADRRGALLDAAARIVTADGVDAVTMDAVADEAGVSRPLVYKHFANRGLLLGELRRRESGSLHEDLSTAVAAAPSAVEMFRTLVHMSLQASQERGALFLALRQVTSGHAELDAEQRRRDRDTVATFARRVAREHGIATEQAAATVAILLSGIDAVLGRWRRDRRPETARMLEETYMTVVRSSLQALSPGTQVEDDLEEIVEEAVRQS